MALKHEPTPIETGVVDPLRLAIYGEGGAGKTSLALTFPYPLVIDTDGGLEGDAIADGVEGEEWSPDSWRDLNDVYKYILSRLNSDTPYRTIVVDSIDTLCRFVLHEAEATPTRDRPANAALTDLITPSQQDYGKVSNAIDIFLQNLKILSRDRGVHIVLTSAVRLPDPEKGRLRRTFDVQPAVEANIKYWANVYGELEVGQVKNAQKEIEERRVLWTSASDPKRNCKSRWNALRPGVVNPTYDKIVGLILEGKS